MKVDSEKLYGRDAEIRYETSASRQSKAVRFLTIIAMLFWVLVGAYTLNMTTTSPQFRQILLLFALLLVVIAMMITVLVAMLYHRLRHLKKGITLSERVISLFGDEVAWSDVEEVCTNPGKTYFSIITKDIIGNVVERRVNRAYVIPVESLLSRIRDLDVDVKDENFRGGAARVQKY